jgi:NADH dehydrogenase
VYTVHEESLVVQEASLLQTLERGGTERELGNLEIEWILREVNVAPAALGAARGGFIKRLIGHGEAGVQAEGAARIARVAAAHGVARMVHISAIGADADAASTYAKTKAAGEAGVLEHMPDAMILRPSIIFGAEDQFFNRFAGMSRMGPVLPVIGADTRFQPVYVDDVAVAAVKGVLGEAEGGVYELGGPDVHTFRELMQLMLGVIRRRRLIVNTPFWMARMMATMFGIGRALTLGLVKGPVTKDQVINLAVDNVAAEDARGFETLGIHPTAMEAVLPDYLWRFRPSGQYDAIKESAKNLKV